MDRVTDVESIHGVLHAYVDGTRAGDVALLRSVFHPNAVMTGYLAGTLLDRSPEPFLEHMSETGGAGSTYRAEITEVRVLGDIATATVVETGLSGLDFVDHFHLVRTDGRWLIVSKLFHHD